LDGKEWPKYMKELAVTGDDFDRMKDSELRIMKATLGIDYASAIAPGITDITGAMKAQDDLAFVSSLRTSESLCDSLKSTPGIDYASAIPAGISSVLEKIKVHDYSAFDHLCETERYPTNLKKIRVPELRSIKPNHSIREDLLLSIKNQEDSISRKYICETLKLLPLCNNAAKIAKAV